MATTPPVIQAKVTSSSVKVSVAPLMIAVVAGIVIAVSAVTGALYFLVHSGRFPIQISAAPSAKPASSTKTRTVILAPLLVNLADSSGAAYLRVAVTLALVDKVPVQHGKGEEAKTTAENDASPSVRDTVLTVLSGQTSETLLGADGKNRLKKELKSAIAQHNPEIEVSDIFFTEFLVQR